MQDVEGPPPGIYGTSPVRRLRATKARVNTRRALLHQILWPCPFQVLVGMARRQLAENPDA
jgi:hypothetical protein